MNEKWNFMVQNWENIFGSVDGVVIVDGVDNDDVLKNKTLAFQSWFMKIEFIDCIMIVTR